MFGWVLWAECLQPPEFHAHMAPQRQCQCAPQPHVGKPVSRAPWHSELSDCFCLPNGQKMESQFNFDLQISDCECSELLSVCLSIIWVSGFVNTYPLPLPLFSLLSLTDFYSWVCFKETSILWNEPKMSSPFLLKTS